MQLGFEFKALLIRAEFTKMLAIGTDLLQLHVQAHPILLELRLVALDLQQIRRGFVHSLEIKTNPEKQAPEPQTTRQANTNNSLQTPNYNQANRKHEPPNTKKTRHSNNKPGFV